MVILTSDFRTKETGVAVISATRGSRKSLGEYLHCVLLLWRVHPRLTNNTGTSDRFHA